jgi:hypothetical protein
VLPDHSVDLVLFALALEYLDNRVDAPDDLLHRAPLGFLAIRAIPDPRAS